MKENIQTLILKTLIQNEDYCRKALPHLKPEYFEGEHKPVYQLFLDFIGKFNKLPTSAVLDIEFQKSPYVNRQDTNDIVNLIQECNAPTECDMEWLLTTTERWCKDRAIHLAIMESISIIDGKSKTLTEGAIPEILSKALSVSFDANVGHDYIENAEGRFNFYHEKEERIPFDLEMMNTITKGGVTNKTLNIILAGTGVGKSLAMCHLASAGLSQGKNVLYITLEMAEERIAERIDANLMDIPIDQIESLPKDLFDTKVSKIKAKTNGKLIVKEYPTSTAHVGHFRALLNELKLKKNFEPDMVFIDYINICASSRVKGLGGSVNTYSLIKAIAEELRGLAGEFGIPVWSATQVTRSGFANTDVELTDTAESFGLPATADLMFALISTEQLENMNQIMVKQLKNRYNDLTQNKRFVLGIDRPKMRLYDVEDSAQTLTNESTSNQQLQGSSFSGFTV
jgi:replicative DNA helicase|tara:strand:+ start:490 stop:1854 length:1365 start_codon:yes stop_codon:yes gene_type:complete